MKTVGILGGMGPEATSNFYRLIIENTPVKTDQEHIPSIIVSCPDIPDRTDAILKNKHKAVLESLIPKAKMLESAGADFIVIPCNTAHFWLPSLKNNVTIPILNMIDLTTEHLKTNNISSVAVVATTGTIKTHLYQESLNRSGIRHIIPNKLQQASIMEVISKLKSGTKNKVKYKEVLSEIFDSLKESGTQHIIMGCTEIPILFTHNNFTIDPMFILAKEVIRVSTGNSKA